jgi:hypothetical protein
MVTLLSESGATFQMPPVPFADAFCVNVELLMESQPAWFPIAGRHQGVHYSRDGRLSATAPCAHGL